MRLTASSGSLRLRTIALRRSNRPEWPVTGRARRSKQQSWLTNSGCRCEDWGELECIQLHLRGTHWRLGPEPVLRSELHRCRHGAIEKCPPQRTLPDAKSAPSSLTYSITRSARLAFAPHGLINAELLLPPHELLHRSDW